MGMDFNVDVNVKTNGKSEVDALEKQIQKLQSTKIDLNVTLGGNGLDLSKIFSGIEKQAEAVGKSIGNSFQKGFKTVKFNGNVDDFYKQYLDQQKKNAKEAENISKQYGVSQKEAVKAVNAKNSAVVKANNEAIKEQQRQQKEIDSIEAARVKSIENAKKREEHAIIAQNKAINKSLENSYKKNQQEKQKLNAQNIAQIRSAEESQKRIQVQQKIAEMKTQATLKNAHNNELVQQGKNNIAKWKQEYNNQTLENEKAYLKQVEEYNKQELEYQKKRKEYQSIGRQQAQEDANGRALVEAYKQSAEYQQREVEYLRLRNQYIQDGKKQEEEFYKNQQKTNAQNLNSIHQSEESQKRIQVQQQIASLKTNATNKNAHYNELVKQGKDNIAKWKQEYEKQAEEVVNIQQNVLNGTYAAKSSSLTSKLFPYSNQDTELVKQAKEQAKLYNDTLDNLRKHFDTNDLFKLNDDEVVKSFETMNNAAKKFDNTMTQIKNTQSKDLGIGIAERSANSVKAYYESNSKAIKKYGAELKDLESRYRSIKTEAEKLSLDNEFKNLQTKISAEGLTGKSAFDEFGRAFKQIGQFAWTYGLIQQIPNAISKSVTELKEINTIVTEISKAADVPVKQIKELETSSFSVASKYGQKASDYLLGVQEMTRAGYSDTSGMAELSTLAQSAGDMTAELANQYLIASDMAFGYGGNVEKLNALLDSQNQITNRNAVSLTELANATKIVASQAAQSGVSEDKMTAALSTMIATTQQGGEIAARAFKGILMNLQQVTGELEDGEVIDEDSLKKVEKRLTGVGVAMKEVKDGTVSLRDPMQVLEELAQVYNSLPDNSVEKAGIISDLGGKYRGNQLAALLANWDKYKKILGDYQNAEGSAAQEAEKTAQSLEGSLNRLSNTWTDLIQNIVDSTSTTNIINFINGIVSGVDTLTEKLGGFKSFLSIVAGGFLTKNGLGKRNAILYKIKQNNRRFINVENFLASNKNKPYSFNY